MQLIDPKMSLDTIRSYIEVWDCKGCLPYGGTQHNVMAVDDLLYLPTIEAEPVRHGRWINDESQGKYICTCCNEGTWRGFGVHDFCPNCGAKMRGDEDATFNRRL